MRKKQPLPIGKLIDEWIDDQPEVQDHLMEVRAINYVLAKYALLKNYIGRTNIRNRIMYISVLSGPLKHQLLLCREELCKEINEFVGWDLIDEIRVF